METNPSRMLSNEDLCDRANELCDGTGLVFIIRRGKLRTNASAGMDHSVYGICKGVLKNEARKLRAEALTHEGYVAGKGLVAQQFELLAARLA